MKRYWQLWLIHVRQWLYISPLEKMLILKEPIFVVQTRFKVWGGGGSEPKCRKEIGKCFAALTVTFLIFFPFYYTSALFISVSFPTGTLSFSSEMDPRCRRWNNNSKCFTLLNGVDVNATAWNLKGCAQLSGLVSLPAQRKKKKKKRSVFG